MSDKQVFPTAEWLDMLEGQWKDFAKTQSDGQKFSICETYIGVPSHLSADGSDTVSFSAWLDGPNCRFTREASEDVDVKVVADYDFVSKLVRFVVTPENQEEYQALSADAVREGKIKAQGDLSKAAFAQRLHNDVARRTA